MTRPSEPGQPYGPPPPRPGGPGQPPPPLQRPQPAPQPGGPVGPQPGWGYQDFEDDRRPGSGKGFFGSLFDTNFNHLVTPNLIKLLYVLLLIAISLWNVGQLALGLTIANWDDGWAWGLMIVIATPIMWLIEIILWRIILEAVIVRFKGVEYLRIIKDKDGTR
jgi:hypothetical protein